MNNHEQMSEKNKGFYSEEQEKIEIAHKDSRYENDKGFRRAIDIKALINEVIFGSSLETNVSDENIKSLKDAILKFETGQNFKSNGIIVRLEDMLDADESKRKEIAKELTIYLSGVNEGIGVALGEKSNREGRE